MNEEVKQGKGARKGERGKKGAHTRESRDGCLSRANVYILGLNTVVIHTASGFASSTHTRIRIDTDFTSLGGMQAHVQRYSYLQVHICIEK